MENEKKKTARVKKDVINGIFYIIKKDPKKKEVDFAITSETITSYDMLVAYSLVIQDCISQASANPQDKALVDYFESLAQDLSRQLSLIKDELEVKLWPKKKNETIALVDIYNRIKNNLESRYEGLVIEPLSSAENIVERIAFLVDLEDSFLNDKLLIAPKEKKNDEKEGDGRYELGGG